MFDTAMATGFEDIDESHDVGVCVGAGVFQAVADASLSSQVNNNLRFEGFPQGGYGVGVFKHYLMLGKTVVALEHRVTVTLQPDIVICRKTIQPRDLMTVGKKPLSKMKTNEAGRARDQNAHDADLRDFGLQLKGHPDALSAR